MHGLISQKDRILSVKVTAGICKLCLARFAAITVVTTVPAKADTGGYPYASIACVWSPYATTGTGNWCKKVNASGQIISDYDWGTIHNDNSSKSEQSPYGYDYRNCTDYVAWEVASLGVLPLLYRARQRQGLAYQCTWQGSHGKHDTCNRCSGSENNGHFGHVAFISAYDSSTGVMTVQEYNQKGDGNYDGTRSGTLSSLGFSKVVHFEKYETGGQLNGTATVSATDVWAVGDRINNLIGGAQTLIEHWNGSSWNVVSSPNPDSQPGSQNALYGVTIFFREKHTLRTVSPKTHSLSSALNLMVRSFSGRIRRLRPKPIIHGW
jgi:hypothetical protein